MDEKSKPRKSRKLVSIRGDGLVGLTLFCDLIRCQQCAIFLAYRILIKVGRDQG